MPVLTDDGFKQPGSIDEKIVSSLKKLKRRVYLVGKLNNKKNGRLFAFGGERLKELLDPKTGNETLREICTYAEPSRVGFLDSVEPLIVEWLIKSANGLPTAGTKVPTGDDTLWLSREVPINPFMLLFDGFDGHLTPELGRTVIAKLEQSSTAYIRYSQHQSDLLAAFNTFLHEDQTTRGRTETLIGASGFAFSSVFMEAFFQYLLSEDLDTEFSNKLLQAVLDQASASNSKKHNQWIKKWFSSDESSLFASLTQFRKELVATTHPQDGRVLTNRVDLALRKQFQEDRRQLQEGIKLFQSRLMLGAVPLWVLSLMFGKHPDKIVHERDASDLLDRIRGKNEEREKLLVEKTKSANRAEADEAQESLKQIRERRVVVGEYGEISLAEHISQVPKTLGEKISTELESRLEGVLVAYIDKNTEAMQVFEELLKNSGLNVDQAKTISNRLQILSDICDKASHQGTDAADKKRKRDAARDGLVASFKNSLDRDYLRLLVGSPVLTAPVFRDKYVERFLGLYIAAQQIASGSRDDVQLEALQERKELSRDLARVVAGGFSTAVDRSLTRFLGAGSKFLTSDVPDIYSALQVYAEQRARRLSGLASTKSTERHSKKSSTRGVGATTETISVEELIEVAAESAPAASPKPTKDAKAIATSTKNNKQSPHEAGDTPTQTLRQRLIELGKADIEKSEPKKKTQDIESEHRGAEVIVANIDKGLEIIADARKQNDTSFKCLDNDVAMREMMMTRHRDLGFGEDYSSLLDFALDLIYVGSNNVDRFLQSNPLSKYFTLEDWENLHDLYKRLWGQLKESCRGLEKFISEVKAVSKLIENCSGNLASGEAELFFYNGSADSFFQWVSNTALGPNQLWAARGFGQAHFIAPSIVCVLESALLDDERLSNASLDHEIKRNVTTVGTSLQNLLSTGRLNGKCPPPVFLFGSYATYSPNNQHWATNYQGLLPMNNKGPTYLIGPAKLESAPGKEPIAQITFPTSLCIVEKVVRGACSAEKLGDHADENTHQFGVVSLAANLKPLSEMVDSFCFNKELFEHGQFVSLQKSLFAQMVMWIHDCLKINGDLPDLSNFKSIFKHIPDVSEFNAEQMEKRSALSELLAILEESDHKLQIDFDGAPYLAVAVAESTAKDSLPWLRFI